MFEMKIETPNVSFESCTKIRVAAAPAAFAAARSAVQLKTDIPSLFRPHHVKSKLLITVSHLIKLVKHKLLLCVFKLVLA